MRMVPFLGIVTITEAMRNMSKEISRYTKVIEDFVVELKANISNLKDTTISYQDAWRIAEALEEIDVTDKVYVRGEKLQSAMESAIRGYSEIIAERVVDDLMHNI